MFNKSLNFIRRLEKIIIFQTIELFRLSFLISGIEDMKKNTKFQLNIYKIMSARLKNTETGL